DRSRVYASKVPPIDRSHQDLTGERGGVLANRGVVWSKVQPSSLEVPWHGCSHLRRAPRLWRRTFIGAVRPGLICRPSPKRDGKSTRYQTQTTLHTHRILALKYVWLTGS